MHDELNEAYPRENEVPFDSERKRMITIHDVQRPQARGHLALSTTDNRKDWHVIAVKGAPDVVLDLCTHYQTHGRQGRARWTRPARQRILEANDAMTQDALRVLGVAYRVVPTMPDDDVTAEELEKDLVFVGLIGMIDPAAARSQTRAGEGARTPASAPS